MGKRLPRVGILQLPIDSDITNLQFDYDLDNYTQFVRDIFDVLYNHLQALPIEFHQPSLVSKAFEYTVDENIFEKNPEETLDQYDILILPNLPYLIDKNYSLLLEFVENGKKLITFDPSFFNTLNKNNKIIRLVKDRSKYLGFYSTKSTYFKDKIYLPSIGRKAPLEFRYMGEISDFKRINKRVEEYGFTGINPKKRQAAFFRINLGKKGGLIYYFTFNISKIGRLFNRSPVILYLADLISYELFGEPTEKQFKPKSNRNVSTDIVIETITPIPQKKEDVEPPFTKVFPPEADENIGFLDRLEPKIPEDLIRPPRRKKARGITLELSPIQKGRRTVEVSNPNPDVITFLERPLRVVIISNFSLYDTESGIRTQIKVDLLAKWAESLFAGLQSYDSLEVYAINTSRSYSHRLNMYGGKYVRDAAHIIYELKPDLCVFNCDPKIAEPLIDFCNKLNKYYKKLSIKSIWYHHATPKFSNVSVAKKASIVTSDNPMILEKLSKKIKKRIILTPIKPWSEAKPVWYALIVGLLNLGDKKLKKTDVDWLNKYANRVSREYAIA